MFNYEQAYNKLVDQIRTEYAWASDENLNKNLSKDRKAGMRFAYWSIMTTIEGLENGTLLIEEDEDEEEGRL